MSYTQLKKVSKWLTRIVAGSMLSFFAFMFAWLSDGVADIESKWFTEKFYEDLMEKDYESIHSYTFRADEYNISVEDVEKYLSDEDLVFILEHKENLTYEESGDAEHRKIVFTTVVNGETYSYGIRITRSLGKFYVHPERDYFLNDYNK